MAALTQCVITLLDARGNFVVLGLASDYCFGRIERLFIMHRYNRTGEYLGGFFEVDPAEHVPPGSRSVSDLYSTLRPLVDSLPVGYDSNGRLFCAIPGANNVQIFDAESFERPETIRLGNQSTQTPNPTDTNPGALFVRMDLRLHALHVTGASSIADFFSAAGRGHFRATYRRSDQKLLSMARITAADGALIQQVGISAETAYAYLPSEQKLLRIR